MNTSKLDYYTRNLSMSKKGDFEIAMDPKGVYDFNFLTVKFLKDPDTKDPFKLLAIPNDPTPENRAAYIEKYVKIFERINELCLENKIRPFFDDPKDVTASELTREDICAEVHDSINAEFFGVKCYYDYNPAPYESEK